MPGGPAAIFFSANEDCHPPNISANHMARILSTSYVHVHVHTRTVNVLRDVNDILRHIKIRAIWLAEIAILVWKSPAAILF